MSDQQTSKISPIVVFLGVVSVVLAGLDISLAMKVRYLSAEVVRLEAQTQQTRPDELSAGEIVLPVVLLDPQGNPVPLSFEPGNGSVLLLVSSGSCQYCEEVRPIWEQVATDAQADGLRVVGLVLDTSLEQMEEDNSPYETYTPGGDALALTSRIPGVPAAILIGENGVVVRAFYGKQNGLGAVVQAHMLEERQQQAVDPGNQHDPMN